VERLSHVGLFASRVCIALVLLLFLCGLPDLLCILIRLDLFVLMETAEQLTSFIGCCCFFVVVGGGVMLYLLTTVMMKIVFVVLGINA